MEITSTGSYEQISPSRRNNRHHDRRRLKDVANRCIPWRSCHCRGRSFRAAGPVHTQAGRYKGNNSTPPKWCGEVWVRLQALYEHEAVEAVVDKEGEFQLVRYLEGNYLLTVFEGGRLLHTRPVAFRMFNTPEPFVVDMRDPAPQPITVR